MGSVLVTGGAGYVGSHIVRALLEAGQDVTVLDDLSEGHVAAVGRARLVRGDAGDAAVLDRLLASGAVDCIVHMAARCEVGASMRDPSGYYAHNLTRTLSLLDAAVRHGVIGVVFSSTAAIYGEPDAIPMDETHPQRPTNPYGETKLAVERALGWYGRAYGLRHVALRYFNAAGAHPSGEIGEAHRHESHLIPRLLAQCLHGGEAVPVFGDDYSTPDGTCVRDYVHVCDLADAHLLALQAMRQSHLQAEAFNLGNGSGFSVREVVDAVNRVTGRRPATCTGPRRPGDPAVLVASSDRARAILEWRPRFPTLDQIVETAWRWHQGHPRGYAAPV
jgi:UDP-glucose 4-epimerase